MARIYTSYFANWRNFPTDALAFGITRFKPSYWDKVNIENLAPSESLLRQYRNKQIDEYMFRCKYFQEIEDRGYTPKFVRDSLNEVAKGRDIILCCYEKPGDFCHRHLLAEWLGNVEEL